MRILFLTRSFNSLAQRLYVELTTRRHEVSVEFDIADSVTEEAVALFRPDLIVAPFLKRAIPASVWRRHVCLIVHPGIVGDRGPSALDWAIQQGEPDWGVTVLQAEAEMDAGPVWAAETFPMRAATKSSLYRGEVTEAAVRAVLAAIDRFATGTFTPQRVTPASITSNNADKVRTPPAALTCTFSLTLARIRPRSSRVAPLGAKPVEVLTQSAPAASLSLQAVTFSSSLR